MTAPAAPESAAGGRGGVALAIVALVLLLPPDTHPGLTPLWLALVALAIATAPAGPSPSGAALLGSYVALAALSLAWSDAPGWGVESLLALVLAQGLFLLAGSAGSPPLAPLAAGVSVFHGLHAAWQRLVSLPRLVETLEPGRSAFEDLVLERASGGRAFSTFALPGHLGGLAAALAPILLIELGADSGRGRKLLAGLGLIGIAAALWSSLALGGTLALGAIAALAWISSLRRRSGNVRVHSLAAAGLLLTLAVVVATRWPHLVAATGNDNPVTTRLVLWQRALQVIATAPVSGRGLGSYPVAWLPFAGAGDVPARNAHMSYLEVAAETGLGGLALLLLFFAAVLERPRSRAAALAASVLLVHAAIDFDLQSPGLLAATMAFAGFATRSDAVPWKRRQAALALLLTVAALVALAREIGRPGEQARRADERSAALERSLAWWPLDSRVAAELVGARCESGAVDRALEDCLRARRREPRTPFLAALEGEVRVQRGEVFAAYHAYRDAAELFPAKRVYGDRAQALQARIEAARLRPSGDVSPPPGLPVAVDGAP